MHPISYGVLLRYDGDLLLKAVPVTIQLLDAVGQPAGGPDGHADADGGCEEFTIEVMFPGQRLGIGALTNVLGEQVTGIDVQLRGPAAWEDPDDHSHPADADTTSRSPT